MDFKQIEGFVRVAELGSFTRAAQMLNTTQPALSRLIRMLEVDLHQTLLVLAFLVMIMAGGAGDWKTLSNINDPLPQAMKMVVGDSSGWLHMLVWLGMFGLIASFHGIILGYSRQIYALDLHPVCHHWRIFLWHCGVSLWIVAGVISPSRN